MASSLRASRPTLLLFGAVLLLFTASAAHAQPALVFFFKVFSPGTIGPGSVSTLVFEISSSEDVPVTDLAFTDTLPVGVTIATPPNASTTCGAGSFIDAPAGGSTITFTGGQLPPTPDGEEGVSCEVTVDVTSDTPGVHTNVSGDLTSNLGNHGDATADLTVDDQRPGFTKGFSPNPIGVGQTSTLTFTIDNGASDAAAFSLTFTDDLPAGLTVASPANAFTDCDGTLTASSGSSTVSLTSGSVVAGGSCTVSVDVLADVAGSLGNTTGNLTSTRGSSGKAAAVLEVQIEALNKAFTDDPVPPGGTVTLRFTITNFDRTEAATDIAFTDDLDDALAGLAAVPPLPAEPCGPGSSLAGTSTLTLSGGSLPAGGSCTFDVTLQVPAVAAPGTYTNTTEPLTATVGGSPVTLNSASDDLVVVAKPVLTKEFTDDPAIPGGTVTLEFTITNSDTTEAAGSIEFLDELTTFLPFPVSVTLPPTPDPPCGAGSSLGQVFVGFERQALSLTGGELPAAGSCTFSVGIDIPANLPGGTFTNTTGPITATVGDETVTGDPATDDLVVVAAPRLAKEFTDDPVQPGDTVTLQFTLTHPAEASGDATGIAFTDDLEAIPTLSGLQSTSGTLTDVCGTGSEISGASTLSFTGGSLSPGDSCTFSVTLQVPAGAPSGNHLNVTSLVQATVDGVATESPAASDLLSVAILTLTKEFIDDPVLPGGTVTLRFRIDNLSPSADATDITFSDDLDDALSGLEATGLPALVCGGTVSGTSTITFSGGTLAAGASCTFDVVLDVPAGAASDTYPNVTTGFSATVEGETVFFPNASDQLTVDDSLLLLTKEFTDDPVQPGDTVTLRFTIESLASEPTTAIAFTDDLDAALTGLEALGLPIADPCGAGSLLAGDPDASTLSLTGGTLPAGGSCTFDVTLQVPAGAPVGTDAVNTTSAVTGTVGGLGVSGDPATDVLQVRAVTFVKEFDGPTVAGGEAVLTFTLTNLNSGEGVSSLGFTDDLDAVVPGLVAAAPLPADPCGAGSSLSGTSVLVLSGGSLAAAGQPGDSCTFDVTLEVPADAAPGDFPNTTSELVSAGLPVADPATDTLAVEPPPGFGKTFAPDALGVGQTSTLTFTIVNTASAVAATDLAFADTLPAGVEVASPPNASTTCTGGTITAAAGGGSIGFSGGTVAAGTSCTVRVDVTPTAAGVHLNTSGALTSSSGSSGTASDVLTASSPPALSKGFAPAAVPVGGTANLTLTIDHSTGLTDATALELTDALPAGIEVADPADATTTCTGGTLTAVAGSGAVSYTGGSVAAGSACSVSVTVQTTAPGSFLNTAELTSSLGSSGTASATLTVDPVPILVKAFSPDTIVEGGVGTVVLTIDNTASSLAATALELTDSLPAGMEVADPANATTDCTGGTLTADPGSTVVTFTGGSVAAGASCAVSFDVRTTGTGSFENTAELASSLGSSGAASAVLVVLSILEIPTASEWGLALLATLMLAAGLWRLRP